MDVHTSFPKRVSYSRASQRSRCPSIYTNPSPVTSRGDSPTNQRSAGAHGGYSGPYRMTPGKSKPSFAPSQPSPKKLDILAPVPRRDLIDSTASSTWLEAMDGEDPDPRNFGAVTPPLSSGYYSRGTSPPSDSLSVSTLYSVHHQHSLTRARSPRLFRDSSAIPTTVPTGTARFLAQQELGVSASSSSFVSSQSNQKLRDRKLSGQSFSTLFHSQQLYMKERGVEGSIGPSSSHSSSALLQQRQQGHGQEEREKEGMGRAWIRWMHKRGARDWVVPSLVFTSTLVKFCISLGSYSGHSTPPMYGDYEAQRHWMELTLHLPFRQWYTYDLQYWGLDYPPLTAYVSWICGVVAYWINPTWVALDASRGIETEGSKTFMRSTVIAWDMLVYVPALLMFAKVWHGNRSGRTQELALLTLLFHPALLLIDFGHFQYNSVMLGFMILAINFFATGHDLTGAIFFVLSLGFKQMALYYAPAIGSYLLARCLFLGIPGPGFKHFTRLAIITVSSFMVLFLPFYLPPFAPSFRHILNPVSRIFPFNRGLFEDKVANFWCASNVVLKWRERVSRSMLVRFSAGLTALGFLPSVGVMLNSGWRMRLSTISSTEQEEQENQMPFLPLLPYVLLASSFSFFLFSFQVHEKTILVPLLPMTLLLSGAPVDSSVYAWGVLVNNIGVFSMWPLLKKDGLGLQYIALLILWNRMIGYNPLRLASGTFVQLFSLATYAAAIGLHVLELVFNPPSRYPDIYPVLNVLVSTPVFVLAWLWSIKCGVEVGWAIGGPGPASSSPASASTQGDLMGGRAKSASLSAGDEGMGSFRQKGGRAVSLGTSQIGRRKRLG